MKGSVVGMRGAGLTWSCEGGCVCVDGEGKSWVIASLADEGQAHACLGGTLLLAAF